MEIVLPLAPLSLTSMEKPALYALMVKFGMEPHVLLLLLPHQPLLQIQQPLDQLQLQHLALHQAQAPHVQLVHIGINNNLDVFLALMDALAVFLAILAPLVHLDFSLTQPLDCALKFVVMERDIPFLVMMVTLSTATVAAAHVKLKTDGFALEDHLLLEIPAARASQLKLPLHQAGNPTNGEESSLMSEPTTSLLPLFNLLVIAQIVAEMSSVPKLSVEILQLYRLLLLTFLLLPSVSPLLLTSKKSPSEFSPSKSESAQELPQNISKESTSQKN
jgi:hypothetical protein